MPVPRRPLKPYQLGHIESWQFGPSVCGSDLLFDIARFVRAAEYRNEQPAYLVGVDVREDDDTRWTAIVHLESF